MRLTLSFVIMTSKSTTTRATRVKVFAHVHVAFFLSILTTLTAHDCHRNMETVWQSDVGSSPVVSSALLADVNGDNVRDVLATSLNGQVSVVDGRSGFNLPGWPRTLPGKLLFSATLLVCGTFSVVYKKEKEKLYCHVQCNSK